MASEIETSKEFWVEFNKKLEEIRTELAGIEKSDDETVNIAKSFMLLKESAVDLQSFATNCTGVLPAYDIRRTNEVSFTTAVCGSRLIRRLCKIGNIFDRKKHKTEGRVATSEEEV